PRHRARLEVWATGNRSAAAGTENGKGVGVLQGIQTRTGPDGKLRGSNALDSRSELHPAAAVRRFTPRASSRPGRVVEAHAGRSAADAEARRLRRLGELRGAEPERQLEPLAQDSDRSRAGGDRGLLGLRDAGAPADRVEGP